ncbi:MAG: SDR family NAD(P)-dependent oxidoreductase [Proteobacteria bacterium]|nr:SDR family NAD(P)-dependent oxidoreductase [Pseudomonadota bacterium]
MVKMNDFVKEIAVVTGASSGLGRAIAIRLAADGYHVLVHYNNNKAGAEQTLNIIEKNNGTADVINFDIKSSEQGEGALEKYFTETNPNCKLAVLVNNAGIAKDDLTGFMSNENFEQVIQTNLVGTFYLLRWAIKKMIRFRSGSIVNIASLSGQIGNIGQINYAASKAGIIAMTKTLAMEVGSRNIRVNSVSPGIIETEMINQIPKIEELKKNIPLQRFGKPEEVCGAVSFLCSKDASYITGQTISVNGGIYTG